MGVYKAWTFFHPIGENGIYFLLLEVGLTVHVEFGRRSLCARSWTVQQEREPMTLDDFKAILTEFLDSGSDMMNIWRRNGYHSVVCKAHEDLIIVGGNLLIAPKKGPARKVYTAIDAIECVSFSERDCCK